MHKIVRLESKASAPILEKQLANLSVNQSESKLKSNITFLNISIDKNIKMNNKNFKIR